MHWAITAALQPLYNRNILQTLIRLVVFGAFRIKP